MVSVTMATAKDKFIEKHFICVICQGEYKDPRRLSCHHVFCRKCLQDLIDTSAGDRLLRRRNELIVGFNCPECRKIIRIPRPREPQDGWAQQFMADFKTANLQADIRDGCIILSEPNNCMKSEAEIEHIASRISKVEVRTDPAERRVRPEIEREENVAVNTEPNLSSIDVVDTFGAIDVPEVASQAEASTATEPSPDTASGLTQLPTGTQQLPMDGTQNNLDLLPSKKWDSRTKLKKSPKYTQDDVLHMQYKVLAGQLDQQTLEKNKINLESQRLKLQTELLQRLLDQNDLEVNINPTQLFMSMLN